MNLSHLVSVKNDCFQCFFGKTKLNISNSHFTMCVVTRKTFFCIQTFDILCKQMFVLVY